MLRPNWGVFIVRSVTLLGDEGVELGTITYTGDDEHGTWGNFIPVDPDPGDIEPTPTPSPTPIPDPAPDITLADLNGQLFGSGNAAANWGWKNFAELTPAKTGNVLTATLNSANLGFDFANINNFGFQLAIKESERTKFAVQGWKETLFIAYTLELDGVVVDEGEKALEFSYNHLGVEDWQKWDWNDFNFAATNVKDGGVYKFTFDLIDELSDPPEPPPAFEIPAGATIVNLGGEPGMTWSNAPTQRGWTTEGTTPWTVDQFTYAVTLVLDLERAPRGGLQLNLMSEDIGWGQSDVLTNSGGAIEGVSKLDGTTLTIDLTKSEHYGKFVGAEEFARIALHYYSSNVADLGVNNAYLVMYKVDLGGVPGMSWSNPDNAANQRGWTTEGATPFVVSDFTKATTLVITTTGPLTGGLDVILMANGGPNWAQTKVLEDDGSVIEGISSLSGNVYTISLDKLDQYAMFASRDQFARIALAYWSPNIADMEILSAYLLHGVPDIPEPPPETPPPPPPPPSSDPNIVKLGEFNLTGGSAAQQRGWRTSNDGEGTGYLDVADFVKAIALVLKVDKVPDLETGMQMVFQGSVDWGWSANQIDIALADVFNEETMEIRIPFSMHPNWATFRASGADDIVRIIIAYYDDNLADLGIVDAWLELQGSTVDLDPVEDLGGGKVGVSISDDKMEELLDAAEGNRGIVTLNVAGAQGGGAATAAVIDNAALKTLLAAEEVSIVSVVMPQGVVNFNAAALASILEQAGDADITLHVEKVDEDALTEAQIEALPEGAAVFSISLMAGDTPITEFNGMLTITLPWTGSLPATVFHLDNDGKLTERTTRNAGAGRIQFDTPSLSIYIIQHTPGSGSDKTGVVMFFGIAGALLATSGAGAVIIGRKLRK